MVVTDVAQRVEPTPPPRWGRPGGGGATHTGPSTYEAGRGHTLNPPLIHLLPIPQPSAILSPSLRTGGLQANSGGGRRAAFAGAQVRVAAGWGERSQSAIPVYCSKTGAPRRLSSHY